ncbi:MAG: NAD-dependent epimerase/dehydratase family protein [Planctomycetes bacterium]|nr:NAD-dependent epimerase/dehydratase family protein [Planctomycetota bacterium]
MRILLTGATGYLGKHLLARFLADGHSVTLLVRQAARLPTDLNGHVETIAADLMDPVPAAALKGVHADVLVHAAAEIHPETGAARLMAVNRDGTIHAIKAAARTGTKRVVLISSLEAAGPHLWSDGEVFEDAMPAPTTEYGRSKLAGEAAAADLTRLLGLELVVLRPGNIYGEGVAGIASTIVAAYGDDHEQLRREWANHRFQPVHISDVVQACVLAMQHGDGVINITDGHRPNVGDLVEDALEVASWRSLRPPPLLRPHNVTPSPERIHYRYRLDRAWNVLGFVPRYSFRTGLLDLVDQLGFGLPRLNVSTTSGKLFTLLLNTPTEHIHLNRDMGGGMGFVHDNADRFPPLDLLYLGTSLKRKGWPVVIVDGGINPLLPTNVFHLINKEGIRAVIAEVNLPTFELDLLFLKELKRFTHARIVAKTALTELHFHERLLREGEVDFVLTGECDLTIDQVLLGLDERGTVRLKAGKVHSVPEDKLVDLSLLPLPDRGLLAHTPYTYSLLPTGFATVQSSRGCPYSCGFYCPYPLTQGKTWRARPAAHVVDELEDCVARGLRSVLFRDATFTLDKARVHEICRLIAERNLKLDWWCETRINCLDKALLQVMAAAGCRGINFGIESGDDEVLAKGAKQGVDVKRIRRVLLETEAVGIHSHLLVVVGLPEETRATIAHTYDLFAELPARTLGVTGITPFPGTALWKTAVERGWVLDLNWEHYGGNHTVMRTENLSPADIRFAGQMLFDGFHLTRPNSGADAATRKAHREKLAEWVTHGLAADAPV